MPKGVRSHDTVRTPDGKILVNIEKLTFTLAANGVDYSDTQIRHLARTGGIPATRVRYRWYFDPELVLAHLTAPDEINERKRPNKLAVNWI